ncbi:hypothetical protein HPB48_015567 [Haemaphysalis longicornis]|uniref:Uncharacterized protein n=1 Tax=Haemaphysalis longicornis TaxID=44386 RepID=A0A9J6FI78_HAELO|nr:hypothetical protein HPB48_015567 [Haemaphysalis longicornis]
MPIAARTAALHFFSRVIATGQKLQAYVLLLSRAESCDLEREFSCDDGWCIDVKLKCNGQFNCKYRYDEESSICQVGELLHALNLSCKLLL